MTVGVADGPPVSGPPVGDPFVGVRKLPTPSDPYTFPFRVPDVKRDPERPTKLLYTLLSLVRARYVVGWAE